MILLYYGKFNLVISENDFHCKLICSELYTFDILLKAFFYSFLHM